MSRSATADEVRIAYRSQIRTHHPDRAGAASAGRAASIVEAYRVLAEAGPAVEDPPPPAASRAAPGGPVPPRTTTEGLAFGAPPVGRVDADTLTLGAPADESFRWLLDAAHDVGEITYECRAKAGAADAFEWVFVGPKADLRSRQGQAVPVARSTLRSSSCRIRTAASSARGSSRQTSAEPRAESPRPDRRASCAASERSTGGAS